MSWPKRWVVLVPREVAWVEKRTREILEESYEGLEIHYTIFPGQGGYQAVVQERPHDREPEVILGHGLSLDCEEPVYSIGGQEEPPFITRFLKGEETMDRREPEDLVRELGCVMPWGEDPPLEPWPRVTRTVMLIQGLSKAKVLRALEKQEDFSPPEGFYSLEEVPQGLLLREGTGRLTLEEVELAYRFPRSTLYAVTARPDLSFFVVCVRHNRKTQEFMLPPREFPQDPVLQDVLGERTPEAILAALGMSREWFQL